jgi:Tfp pilus assembly protein FimT
MLMVIIVLAIIAAMVVPHAVGSSGMQAQAAARMLMSDLEYAQSQAIATQETITVTFDPAANSYTFSNASGTLIHPITKQAYVVDLDTTAGFDSVSLSSANFGGAATVSFDALGAPDQGGAVRLTAGGSAYDVNVAAVTGRVSVAQAP